MTIDDSKVSSVDQELIEKLGSLHEDVFTDQFLRPLFCAMGYERVEFYGGSHERGRDLIASRRIPPKLDDYVVFVQSKRTRGMTGARGAQKFSAMVHQLRQCVVLGVDRGDGKKIKPSEVYLVSPDIVSQRMLDELAEQLCGINPIVRVLDGVEILRWIREFSPDLLRSLSSLKDRLVSIESIDVKNSELILALSSQRAPDLTDLYRDLSFFVGSVDSNALLHLKIDVDSQPYPIEPSRWLLTRKQIESIRDQYGFYFLSRAIEEVEIDYERHRRSFESAGNQSSIKLFEENSIRIRDAYVRIESMISTIEGTELSRADEKVRKGEADSIDEALLLEINLVKEALRVESASSVNELINSDEVKNRNLFGILSEISQLFERKEENERIKSKIVPPPKFVVRIDSVKVSDHIEAKKKRYFDGVIRISEEGRSPSEIREFLSETESTLGLIELLRSKEFELNRAFTFAPTETAEDRVSISPHEVFDSRRNVAVYGGAGVGKTTTLKAYVSKSIRSGRKDVIYVPLNRVTERFVSMKRELGLRDVDFIGHNEEHVRRVRIGEQITTGLLAKIVLASRGLDINSASVAEAEEFLKSGVTLVLDGLDEIFDTLKEILPAIAEFSEKNPGSQLIVSSRDCVSYLSSIKFLGITLLPFTKDQLIYFVRGWVTSDEKRSAIVISIVSGGLYEHIRTPLLATIACSLAEKGIKVVSNEREIYYERLRLLTGAYDESKGIRRQKQTSELLMSVARRVAFELHANRSRSLPWKGLLDLAKRSLMRRMEGYLVEKCLAELIDPCNVLVLDADTQEFGFGHFRFQEHLVSEEFTANREIQVALYAGSDWWRGAVCLYAQQIDPEILFKEVYSLQGQIGRAYQTLNAIVEQSSPIDRSRLKDALSMYVDGDGFDSLVVDDLDHFSDHPESGDILLELGIGDHHIVDWDNS